MTSALASPLHARGPDVDQAGLFVLARCGMIYMEPHQLGWKPLKDSYMDTLPSSLTEEHRELVRHPPPRFPSFPGSYASSGRTSRRIFTFIFPEAKGAGNSLPGPSYLAYWLPTIFPTSPHGGHGLVRSVSPLSSSCFFTPCPPMENSGA